MLLSHEELFLYSLNDLRNRIEENTAYSLVRGCGVCRHFLTDRHPLIHIVNRKYRAKIEFKIYDFDRELLDKPFKVGWATVYPYSSKSILVSLDNFLKTKILYYNDHRYDVCDVIRVASHVLGGVHSFDPEGDKESAFIEIDKAFEEEKSRTIIALRDICKVVEESAIILERKITGNTAVD